MKFTLSISFERERKKKRFERVEKVGNVCDYKRVVVKVETQSSKTVEVRKENMFLLVRIINLKRTSEYAVQV